MNYIDNSAFKQAVKTNKSVSVPIRKIVRGMPTIVADRQIKFVFSSPTVDRDFDLITQEGIDLTWFETNPLVFYSHDHESLPIGKCVSVAIENGSLTGVIEFAPLSNPAVGEKAEGIFQLCKDGYLSAVSIGFIPCEVDRPKDQTRYNNDGVDIKSCELVEVSICGIQSNRSALIQEVGAPAELPIEPINIPPTKSLQAPRLLRVLESLD